MFLSPDQFLEKYRNEGMPYFKVFQGKTTRESACMTRFTEPPEDADGYDVLNEGSNRLEAFFGQFPDGGNLTVMTKGSPNAKNDSANVVNVRWGTQGTAAIGHMSAKQGQYYHPQAGMFAGQDKMLVFLSKMHESTQEARILAIEGKADARIRELELRQEHKEELEDVIADLTQPAPTIGQTFQHELLGLMKPLAIHYMNKNGIPHNQHAPAIMGMERTQATPPTATADTAPQQTAVPAPAHPMHGADLNLIMNCARGIAENVFPDYNVNEALPALMAKCIEEKELIRSQVIPVIDQMRLETQNKGA